MPEFDLDKRSNTVRVPATASLSEIESMLNAQGLTLNVRAPDMSTSVGAWLSAGAPGAPDKDNDPVSQLVCGLDLALNDGRTLSVRPAPRRAVGPDLIDAMIKGADFGKALSVVMAACTHAELECLTFAFESRPSAERARTWIRGRGVRPRRIELVEEDGVKLRVFVEANRDDLSRARRQVIDEVVAKSGGTLVSA